jgi:hypothetical protein
MPTERYDKMFGGKKGSANTFKKGQVITIAGYYRVHPKTTVDSNILQKFIITADKTSKAITT